MISFGRQVAVITWDGTSDKVTDFKKITEVDTEEASLQNRINDAKCDATGRLWCGTMGPEPTKGHITPYKGSFYSVDSNGKVKRHITPVSCSNGLAWNSDGTKFYYIDSGTREVHEYDIDLSSGVISMFLILYP